jgi:hypothetical protein
MARFVETGLLEETIYLGREAGAELSYALVRDASRNAVDVESASHRVAVILPDDQVRHWCSTEQVGIAGDVDLGLRGTLSVLVEKDFACLDRSDEENADTFPHPHAEVHRC